jgi:luciferase family oxidoreductase group 1
MPAPGNRPPLWLLGSSGYSAQLAGALGLPFAFAHHFSAANTLPALGLYRSSFRPSAELAEPYAIVAVSVVAAETDADARRIAAPSGLAFLRLSAGRPGPLPSPAEEAAYPYSPAERVAVEDRMASQVVGGPDTVRRDLHELLDRTAADELMITTVVYDHADRLRSYEQVSEVLSQAPAERLSSGATGRAALR